MIGILFVVVFVWLVLLSLTSGHLVVESSRIQEWLDGRPLCELCELEAVEEVGQMNPDGTFQSIRLCREHLLDEMRLRAQQDERDDDDDFELVME